VTQAPDTGKPASGSHASVQIATPAWAEVMASIHASAFPPYDAWDPDAFRTQLSLPGVTGLVHADGGVILVRLAADEAEILTLAVAPEARRRGIACQLILTAIQHLSALGATILFLEVSTSNSPALALYDRCGFRQVGQRRNYYLDGTDALVLRRTIAPA
jgi:[ribosomal protein S18]-alanine N-acetyltransferase